MKACAESKCFRRGYAFSGDWGRTNDLIVLIIVTFFFPTGRREPAPFRHIAREASHPTTRIPALAETKTTGHDHCRALDFDGRGDRRVSDVCDGVSPYGMGVDYTGAQLPVGRRRATN